LLRIISGKLKGRKLRTLKGQSTRPTLEKTRETIFNILQSRLDLTRYEAYDLFAGSGALGFEAFSRGADQVTFIENNRASYTLLKSNIDSLSLSNHCSTTFIDAIRWIKSANWTGKSKLFLLDPPYQSDLLQSVINELGRSPDIPENSAIVLETEKQKEISYPDHFQLFRQKMFGKTRIDFIEIRSQI